VAAYAVKQSAGKFALVGQMYGTAPYGIAVPKKSSALPQQILTALKTLMTNGTYTGILTKWGVQGGAISNPTINGATS
jgi:polar amino acid transport system substrate-binding protein